MTVDMFPLGEIPYDAYSKLLTTHRSYLKPFVPSRMEEDLKSGEANALVYWYPNYILSLYDLASEGIPFEHYFRPINIQNYWLFIDLFVDTAKKLDKLTNNKIKDNILGESRIINGKLK